MSQLARTADSKGSQIVVKPVTSWWQRRQFLNVPWEIYSGDLNWVPPLRGNAKEMLNFTKHPFYETAEIQTFLAYRNGTPVGRVAAIVNRAHNERYKEKRGFFGFFESEDSQETASALFDAAREWLREKGMTAIRGPMNPSMNHECGLLIDGFHEPPTFMMTYNRPYYQRLIETYGFRKVEDMVAFWGHINMITGLDKKMAFIIGECQSRFDIKLRRLDPKHFDRDVRIFLDIYNRSLVGTWGFVPLSAGETKAMASGLKMLIVPEMTAIAEIEGKPVGAVFGLLDYNPRIKEIGGRLFPFGFLKLLFNRKALKRIRVLSTNVIPEYQKWGVGLLIVSHLLPAVQAWGIEEAEFSWVLESNTLSYATLQRGGAKITHKYRIFDYEIPAK
ncbi:MAG: N-acetyltransferase [Pirellulaceae bacterium]